MPGFRGLSLAQLLLGRLYLTDIVIYGKKKVVSGRQRTLAVGNPRKGGFIAPQTQIATYGLWTDHNGVLRVGARGGTFVFKMNTQCEDWVRRMVFCFGPSVRAGFRKQSRLLFIVLAKVYM